MTPEQEEIKGIIASLMKCRCTWHGSQRGMNHPEYTRDGGSVHYFAVMQGLIFHVSSLMRTERGWTSGVPKRHDPALDVVHKWFEMWVEDPSARTGRRKPMQKVYIDYKDPLFADVEALFDAISKKAKIFRPGKENRESALSALKAIRAAIE